MNKKVISVFGTRPEAIKMAPLIKVLEKAPGIQSMVCSTGQHAELLEQVLTFFDIKTDFDFQVMAERPGLTGVYSLILQKMQTLIDEQQPDLIIVHGDTATTAAASMAAFCNKVPVAHVEAGLRTGDMYSPWPEEFNRRLAGMITDLHFAPTEDSMRNLIAENVNPQCIVVTGNTVVDSLFLTLDKLQNDKNFRQDFNNRFPFLKADRKLVLVTGHRRENFGEGLENICMALERLSGHKDVNIVYPVHPNPNVKEAVHKRLGHVDNIHLIDPLEYNDFVYLMSQSYMIITDSGGIQEEAPSLGKPVLVTRNTTERPEAVAAGAVELVGTKARDILQAAVLLIQDSEEYLRRSQVSNPYGDGRACLKILEGIYDYFGVEIQQEQALPVTFTPVF